MFSMCKMFSKRHKTEKDAKRLYTMNITIDFLCVEGKPKIPIREKGSSRYHIFVALI